MRETTPSIFKRHPLVAFFLLAYFISWTSFFVMGGPFLFPFGSIIAAIIVLALAEGGKGLKDLLSRCLRWRVSWICYLAAVAVPTALALGAVYLAVAVGGIAPPKFDGLSYDAFLILPIAIFDAPLWEDSGWRGFAMPRFPAERSRFFNTLVIGVLLAGWHLPIALSAGAIAVPYIVTTFLSAFVTNWIYYISRQSALLAILYHGAANAVGQTLFHGYSEQSLLWLYWSLAATNLAAVLIILSTARKLWYQREHAELIEASLRPLP